MFHKTFDVAWVACAEIIETDHFVVLVQETLAEVRPEKTGPSSHDGASTPHP
jgi:hypothetical protein